MAYSLIKFTTFTILLLLFGVNSIFASSVVLNELMPHPSPGSDWVEIYNPTSSNIDLSNWTLVDSTSIMKTLSGNIAASGFVTFDVTNRLNNSGDNISLKDVSGATIDNYSYSSDPGVNISFGRSPDGENWGILSASSKGDANGTHTQTPEPTFSPTPTPTSTPSPTPAPTSNPSSSKSKTSNTNSKTPAPTPSPSTLVPSPQNTSTTSFPSKSLVKVDHKIAAVAGVTNSATPSTSSVVKSQKQINYLFWVGVILIFAGMSSIGYIYLRKNADIRIKLRKRN